MDSDGLAITFDLVLTAMGFGVVLFARRIPDTGDSLSEIDQEEVWTIRALGLVMMLIGLVLAAITMF